MAITTFDGFIAAPKQGISLTKTASRAALATGWFGTRDLAGNPGAGVLNVGNTANGVVPSDLTAGNPLINAFSGANKGYLAQVEFGSSVACRMKLFDRVFSAGAYAFNANTALAAQPSFASRVPGGTDFTDTQIWIEAVTAFTGNPTFTVTYMDQAGAAGNVAILSAGLAPTIGRWLQLPMAAGDTGVQVITNVQCAVSTVGTFNVHVVRPLWSGRVKIANDGDNHDLAKTGMPEVFADSAIELVIAPDSTATGIPDIEFVIANG